MSFRREGVGMEVRRAQKRPLDLNAVLDHSLQFATWDSDPEPSPSPEKKPRLLDDSSNGSPQGDKQQCKDASVSSGDQETLQYQSSDVPSNGDSLEAESCRVNGDDEVKEHGASAEASCNRLKDRTGMVVNGNGDYELSGERADSPDTVVLSEEETAEVEGGDQTLTRAATMVKNVDPNISIAPVESGTAALPTSAPKPIWKDTSIEKDAGMVTSIIPDANLSAVMDCLARHRADPDRLNVVMAAMLDRTSPAAADGFPDNGDQMAETSGVLEAQTAGIRPTQCQTVNSCEPHRAQQESENHTSGNGGSSSRLSGGDRNPLEPSTPGGRERTAVEGAEGYRVANVDGHSTQQDSSDNGNSLYKDVKNVIVKIKTQNPHASVNATEVYTLLEQQSDWADRADLVCRDLLKKYGGCSRQNQASSDNSIFNQAVKLTSEFPHMDPSEIYELLEKEGAQDNNAFQTVRDTLRAWTRQAETPLSGGTPAKPSPVPKEDSISSDPLVRNDPVFRDMRIISRMFPERDQNELYALVEAHYYRQDRVQAVIEELLQTEKSSQDSSQPPPQPQPPADGREASSSTDDLAENIWHAEVDHLQDIFPDCDPNYIYERLEACKGTPDRVKVIAAEMLETKNYPRLKDVEEKQTKAARKRHLQRMEFTMEEFLAKFPDPGSTFRGTDKEMKDSYKSHVDSQLRHDFPDLRSSYVGKVVHIHRHHLLPTARELEAKRAQILAKGGRSKKLRDVPKEVPLVYPEEPDEYFFCELWFTLNEQKVKDHFEGQAALRQSRVEEARARKELYECGCCFEDECLFEDMNTCADGHLFCRQCIARSAEAAFGEGKTTFPCLTGTCEHQIPLSVLKEVLPSSMFSRVLRKLQEEEVRQAGIADLVECPFCSFATIMADPDDRVFRCLNPECLKDSCRLCREPNHVPLKCQEVEKQSETDMRTFIEKRVTEAMLRKCHRCGKRFVKDIGCNKMTCICGATSCYVCREPDIDYDHFNGHNCREGDTQKLHQQEMERAAREAREEYLRQHPEAATLELRYDPAHLLQPTGRGWRRGHRRRKKHRTRRR